MAITYRYKTVKRPDGSDVKSPSIPITLRGKNYFDAIALIDSGADLSVITEELAQILGLHLEEKEEDVHGAWWKIKSKIE